ncbi:hypothetical protein HY411_00180 [Candidatus Gottesmanbacteria bacterium]|nr:hypothetical protein [Candidatus Gottesmanbacteria bacterium]
MEKPGVPAVIRELVGSGSPVKKIEEGYTFTHPCQGEIPVACSIMHIVYDTKKVDPDHELPLTAIVVDDPDLGQGAHEWENATKEAVAEELIDGLCVKAGCANGANCTKKRPKSA